MKSIAKSSKHLKEYLKNIELLLPPSDLALELKRKGSLPSNQQSVISKATTPLLSGISSKHYNAEGSFPNTNYNNFVTSHEEVASDVTPLKSKHQ